MPPIGAAQSADFAVRNAQTVFSARHVEARNSHMELAVRRASAYACACACVCALLFCLFVAGSTAATLPMHKEHLHVWHLYTVGGLCPVVMALLVRGYVGLFAKHLPREHLTTVQG